MDTSILSKAWQLFRQKKINSAIDELEKNSKNTFYDIDHLIFKSEKLLVDGKFEEAEKNYTKAIEIANEKIYNQGLGYAYLKLSVISYRKGKFEDALKNAKISLNFFDNNIIPIEEGKLDTNNNIGSIYFAQGNYKEAETVFNQTLEISKSLDITIDIIRSLNNLGIMLHLQGEHQKALEYYKKASKYALNSDEALSILATIFNNIADLEMIQGFYSKAEINFLKALKFIKEFNIERKEFVEGLIYQNLGSLYSQRGEFDKAESVFSKSIDIFKQSGRMIN